MPTTRAKTKGAVASVSDRLDELESGAPVLPEEHAPSDDRRFATAADLGPEEAFWVEEFQLPTTRSWVLVRALDSVEMTELVELPDLFNYRAIMLQSRAVRDYKPGDADKPEPVDGSALTVEQTRWLAHLGHLAITLPGAGPDVFPCRDPDCGMRHPASLWTVAQCRRMNVTDLDAVTTFALRGRLGQLVGPFSAQPQDSDTPAGATDGGSIPDGTS